MPLPPRAQRLAFFVYEQPVWSIGDRLHATFDFESEAALRAALSPLSLDWLADKKLLEEHILVLDTWAVDAHVFGNLITLTVGPEDTYEHLGAADYDVAEALETRFHAAGLERYRCACRNLDDWTVATPPAPPAPPRAQGPPRFVIEIEAPSPGGWSARVRERLGGQASSFDRVAITADTRAVDLGSGAPAGEIVLEAGQLAVATMTIAQGSDGMMHAAVDRLELIRPEPALVARIAAAFAALKGAGMLAGAPQPWEIARDFLLHREVAPSHSVEALLDATLDDALFGRTVEGYPLLSHHVGWALSVLCRLKLPCLFSAHRAVTEAVACCRRGDPPEKAREALFHQMVGELHRSLEGAGDARRFLPVRLLSRPEVVTYLLLTEAQRRALLDAGLAGEASTGAAR